LYLVDLESALTKYSLDFLSRKESHMFMIEESSGFISPISIKQGLNQAVMSHVRNAGHQASLRPKPSVRSLENSLGIVQVFQDVSADDAIERGCLEFHLLKTGDDNSIEPASGAGRSGLVPLDTGHLRLLARLDGLSKAPGGAADVQDPLRRVRN
jgi:hypothetical protein